MTYLPINEYFFQIQVPPISFHLQRLFYHVARLSLLCLYLPAFERSPATAGELLGRADFVFSVFVHFDPCFGLFGEVEDFARVGVHLFNESVNG